MINGTPMIKVFCQIFVRLQVAIAESLDEATADLPPENNQSNDRS